jgi:hypothetical protein
MADQLNMTQVVLKNFEENGAGAQFNRDLAVGYISPELIDREAAMRKELMPEIEAANLAVKEDRLTPIQAQLIIDSAMRSLNRQADFNDRLLAKRR